MLNWTPGSIEATLQGGEPTIIRERVEVPPDVDVATAPIDQVAEMLLTIRRVYGEEVYLGAIERAKMVREAATESDPVT